MVETIKSFAGKIAAILKTDRWVNTICTGGMGEGKSCFTSQTAKETAKIMGTPFSYKDNMTFSRKELKMWIDGDKEGKNRKPEFSVILADEIISMFFKRNWYDSAQIDGIELLNKCRDRHLCVFGNVPNFWDLDSAIYSTVTFWVHIHERGRAWVFQSDRNPFANDKWHKKDNQKKFRKTKNPYGCLGFVCEIHFDDWQLKEKEEYYAIRNVKRVKTEGQRTRIDRYGDVKKQRDELLRFIWDYNKRLVEKGVADPFKKKDLADISGLTDQAVAYILRGER